MFRNSLLLAAFASLAVTSAVAAPKVGFYTGTSEDGAFISFEVIADGAKFEFSNVDVNMQPKCTHPNRTASEGWGFFLGQDIVDGDNPFHSGNDYYDTTGTLHFTGPNTIKGTITSVTAVFTPTDPPKKAQFCKAAKQAFTLTFQTAPGRDQHGTATVLEKRRTQ